MSSAHDIANEFAQALIREDGIVPAAPVAAQGRTTRQVTVPAGTAEAQWLAADEALDRVEFGGFNTAGYIAPLTPAGRTANLRAYIDSGFGRAAPAPAVPAKPASPATPNVSNLTDDQRVALRDALDAADEADALASYGGEE